VNGCGGESITVKVDATLNASEDYDSLYTKAIEQAARFLPGRAIHRSKESCGYSMAEEWYVGCAHSGVSPGGTKIEGVFSFVRYGAEETV
jgi:hypothetical protein